MALLLDEIDWERSFFPEAPVEPEYAARFRRFLDTPETPAIVRLIAPSRWIREAYLYGALFPTDFLRPRLKDIAALVTAQESACRYCYGVARTNMRMLGYADETISKIEHEVLLSEASDAEVIQFCRNLARSNPRPARSEAERLTALGYMSEEVVELAFVVAIECFMNRLATLVAAPPPLEYEAVPDRWWVKLFRPYVRWRMRRQRSLPDWPEVGGDTPFAPVGALLAPSRSARLMLHTVSAALASPALPPRTKGWMIAVVARTVGCELCDSEARRLLQAEGVSPEAIDEVLERLGSPVLDETEHLLVPWVRDTVRVHQPAPLQRRTSELLARLGPEVTLEAVGVASLANALVRLAMLAQ